MHWLRDRKTPNQCIFMMKWDPRILTGVLFPRSKPRYQAGRFTMGIEESRCLFPVSARTLYRQPYRLIS